SAFSPQAGAYGRATVGVPPARENLGGAPPGGSGEGLRGQESRVAREGGAAQALRATLALTGAVRVVGGIQRPGSGAPGQRCSAMERTWSRSSSSRTSKYAWAKPARTWVEERPR